MKGQAIIGFLLGATSVLVIGGLYMVLSHPASADGAFIGYSEQGKVTDLRIPYSFAAEPATRALSSPNGEKVAYITWEDAAFVFYVTDTEGSFSKQISRQHVGEGSGEVDLNSFQWADDEFISYHELSLECPLTTCQTPDDFVLTTYAYKVNVTTGEETKTALEQSGF